MHLDEPLSDKEFNELDKFLMSDSVGDDGMTMDALHGYLTAIALGPEMIPMAEWLPTVLLRRFFDSKEGLVWSQDLRQQKAESSQCI